MASVAKTPLSSPVVSTASAEDPIAAQYVVHSEAAPITGSDVGEDLYGTDGDDYIIANGGDDTIYPLLSTTYDEVFGGEGLDTLVVDYSSSATAVRNIVSVVTSPGGSSTFYFIQADGGGMGVRYSGIERFIVTGSATAGNGLRGGAYDDYLVGGSGSDFLFGYGEGSTGATEASSGDDTIDVGKGGATGAATGFDDVRMGSGGNDHLIVDYSAATQAVSFGFYGSSTGVDYYTNSTSVTIGGVNTLSYTGVERFTVSTGSANDTITTGAGADVIDAGSGDDAISSGRGKVHVDGGFGTDTWAADLSYQEAAIVLDLNAVGLQTLADGSTVIRVEGFGPAGLVATIGDDILVTKSTGTVGDTIQTHDGNDTVTLYGATTGAATGFDHLQMGTGDDDHLIVDYSAASEAVLFTYYGSSLTTDYYTNSTSVTIGGVSTLVYSGVERFTVRTGFGNDTIATGANSDAISSGDGNDTINSGVGQAAIDGGAGTDTWAADLSYQNAAILLNLNLAGVQALADGSTVYRIEGFGAAGLVTGAGNDVVVTRSSGTVADTIRAGAGNDTVTVFSAATAAATGFDDVQLGGGGDDHLIVNYAAATQAVVFGFYGDSMGVDYYTNSTTVTLGGTNTLVYSGVERFTVLTGSANDTIVTGVGIDVINAGAGHDTINSGSGKATIEGASGLDSWAADLSYQDAAIVLNLNLNQGAVQMLADGSSVHGIEAFGGPGGLVTGIGNDVIVTMSSGVFADTVQTGGGDDTVTVFAAATGIGTGVDNVAMGSGGNDHLVIDYSAATQAVSFGFYGSSLGTDYYTNSTTVRIGVVNTLAYSGVERFTVRTGSADDVIATGDGADLINAGGGSDSINAGAGADSIDGGAGTDTMTGGGGDDTYYVDDGGDQTTELAGEGTDRVYSSVTFTLAANVEELVLTGAAGINGTGNGLANRLVGNGVSNILDGGEGADTMEGKAGNDIYIVDNVGDKVIEASSGGIADTIRASVSYSLGGINAEYLELTGTAAINGTGNSFNNRLTGNDAANVLDGREGADKMEGKGGDDTYFVDTAGDTVIEAADGGYDTVKSAITYSLAGQHIEKLELTGSAAIDATGNGLANTLIGNGGANRLSGGTGADTMEGRGGNDTYVIDNAGDIAIEASGGGIDTVESVYSHTLGTHFENLTLIGGSAASGTGNAKSNVMIGNNAGNALSAGGEADHLYGRGGNDTLTGGTGTDSFYFDTALGTGNVDKIADFSVADDTIQLNRTIFTGITANGTLAASAFVSGTAAGDGDDRILYDAATGKIFYDADGNGAGAAVLFAQVSVGTALTNLDFDGYLPA
ncbi:MAG TPA: calcium-binding protein [Allosphingosinicella sp.]